MEAADLAQLEELCAKLYGAKPCSEQERLAAHRALLVLQLSAQYIPQVSSTRRAPRTRPPPTRA